MVSILYWSLFCEAMESNIWSEQKMKGDELQESSPGNLFIASYELLSCLHRSAPVWLFPVKFNCQSVCVPLSPLCHQYLNPGPYHSVPWLSIRPSLWLLSSLFTMPALIPWLNFPKTAIWASYFMLINFSCFFTAYKI